VRVPRLFELHALPTVWQMTSTVTAVSRAGLTLAEAFAALFPCGSVTGAPGCGVVAQAARASAATAVRNLRRNDQPGLAVRMANGGRQARACRARPETPHVRSAGGKGQPLAIT